MQPPFAAVAAEAAARGGFCRAMTHHIAAFLPDGQRRLIVTFDNLASDRETERRYPWGHAFLATKGWDMLGIMTLRNDWFRHADVWDLFDDLRENEFFKGYDHVAFYGASAGAYGALTFAPAAPGCTVVAFAPQSSLDTRLVPFEKRYQVIGDWAGRYADAARGVHAAGRVYIGYDPWVHQDHAHAMRLLGPKVTLLPMRGAGHKVPPALQRMGILKPVAMAALDGTLDLPMFHHLYRGRRNSVPWIVSLMERAAKQKHARLALRVMEAHRAKHHHWKFRLVVNDLRTAAQAKMDQ
jgi:hypothetical protein